MKAEFIKNIESSKKYHLSDLIEIVPGGVESRTLVQVEGYSVTLFGLDEGEGISAFTVPGDTLISLYEGKSAVTIGETQKITLSAGESVCIPSNTVYSIDTLTRSKLLIILVNE
jgi:quercetin dioxygenase-like cupin family protein